MTNTDPTPGRRDRLQARLETAVGHGELGMDEYEDLCARIWNAENDDDSPELDPIAGRLERIESARSDEGGRGRPPAQRPAEDNPYRHPDPYRRGSSDLVSGGTSGASGTELIGTTPDADRQPGRPAIFSDKSVTGRWAPKAETTWWSLFGEHELDLRDADWPAARVVLDFQFAMGEAKIIVPPGTTVVDETTAIFGEVNVKTRAVPSNGLTVVLDGILMMSELKVRDR